MSDNMFNKEIKAGGLGAGIISQSSYAELQKQPTNPAIDNANNMLQFMGALMQVLPQLQQQTQQVQKTTVMVEPETPTSSEETLKEFREMQEALKINEKTGENYLSDTEDDNYLEGTTTAEIFYEEEPFPGEQNYFLVSNHTEVVTEDLNKATLQNKLQQLESEANKVREKLQEIYFEEWKSPLFDGLKQVLNSSGNSIMLVYPTEDSAIIDVLELASVSDGVKQYTSETMSVFVTDK